MIRAYYDPSSSPIEYVMSRILLIALIFSTLAFANGCVYRSTISQGNLIEQDEIQHVHFQDVPDMPRELLTGQTRAIPGDGIAPVARVLRTLAEKGYAGPLSVELFLYTDVDPYELAREIREKAEPVMREAGVL